MTEPKNLIDEDVFNNMNELEKAQVVLQLVMTRYNCNESEAKAIISKNGVHVPGLFVVAAPAFSQFDGIAAKVNGKIVRQDNKLVDVTFLNGEMIVKERLLQ